jgi:hypothetical protein
MIGAVERILLIELTRMAVATTVGVADILVVGTTGIIWLVKISLVTGAVE